MSTNILPGDRLNIDGADRIVTSAVPATHRGRHSILVAHVDPSDVRDGYAFSSDATVTHFPDVRPLSARPYGQGVGMSPGEVAAGGMARTGATTRTIPLPESSPTARAEYVAARERGESVPAALSRARAETVAHRVLSPADPWDAGDGALDAYDVDTGALVRHTLHPRYAALAGGAHYADGEVIPRPIIFPFGARVRLYVYADDDAAAFGADVDPDGAYSPEDVQAWRDDRWSYVQVHAVVVLPDGRRGTGTLGGVEMGDYWPGSAAGQVWPAAVAVLSEALADVLANGEPDPVNIPEDERATCGECGRSWSVVALPTPAGRCPWEYEHRVCPVCEVNIPGGDAEVNAHYDAEHGGDEAPADRPGITLTRERLEAWAGRELTDAEVYVVPVGGSVQAFPGVRVTFYRGESDDRPVVHVDTDEGAAVRVRLNDGPALFDGAPDTDESPAANLAAWVRAIVDELDPDDREHREHDPDVAGHDPACPACWGDRLRDVLDAEGAR